MAWKICGGKLLASATHAMRISRACLWSSPPWARRWLIRAKGSGSVERDLTPEELIDASLAAFVKSHYDMQRANRDGGHFTEFNQQLREMAAQPGGMHPDDVATFKDFHVHMGFGMHIGWAIEGAIGSKYKIDASYLR